MKELPESEIARRFNQLMMPVEESSSRRQRISGAVIYLSQVAEEYEVESRKQVQEFMIVSNGDLYAVETGDELDDTFSSYEVANLRRIAQTDAVQAIYKIGKWRAKRAFNKARRTTQS